MKARRKSLTPGFSGVMAFRVWGLWLMGLIVFRAQGLGLQVLVRSDSTQMSKCLLLEHGRTTK